MGQSSLVVQGRHGEANNKAKAPQLYFFNTFAKTLCIMFQFCFRPVVSMYIPTLQKNRLSQNYDCCNNFGWKKLLSCHGMITGLAPWIPTEWENGRWEKCDLGFGLGFESVYSRFGYVSSSTFFLPNSFSSLDCRRHSSFFWFLQLFGKTSGAGVCGLL